MMIYLYSATHPNDYDHKRSPHLNTENQSVRRKAKSNIMIH